ncbi:superoxide dismutase family protein [Paenibacillus hamazuiensis]|uniref:superoxide dismutase family protein n=1 Tax=Paenibacillus hamazuiensis TaxID=2936508 RepID=UPI0020105434|nr:superoxide dismutase family protein [Paenibacillus hamazuiensis]
MKTTFTMKHITGAFLCGAIFFAGVAGAAGPTQMSFDKVSMFVNGTDRTSSDGQYDNQGTKVPESLIYEGTTYVPIRKISELLGVSVYWEGTRKAVSIGNPYVVITDGSGKAIGHAELTPTDKGVKIHLEASGLTPGKHGFHIHQNPITNNDFNTAGGHFNPNGKKHGHDSPDGMHLGDMPNLEVGADGTAKADIIAEGASLDKGGANSLLGHSIVIHAKEDDGKTDPSGNSGDRIAGGNIPD